ncbi:PucR family transcriptional regulator [Clostridium felsineum]|uniref:PucR family transcriptional regulator n=1 Tax=Clostridium felsineum TaxID=36839 RepID=UPI00098C7F7E|nr:helix-turn-helix domain-containing protein [Clostridium felsineum]URZ03358.1 hypothetical protein CLAUR_034040 [Clostridium felsineum]
MKELKAFLRELEDRSGIKFKVSTEKGELIYKSDSYDENSNNTYHPFALWNNKFVLSINKEFQPCVKLLLYSIENKYNEISLLRYKDIEKLIEGKNSEVKRAMIEMIKKDSALFLIRLNSNVYDALNVINQMYTSSDIIKMVYKSDIIVLGEFEDVHEHAVSIREAIISNLFCSCVVSFSEISRENFDLESAYKRARECLVLCENFSIKEEVIDYNKLFLEKITYYMNKELKEEILNRVKNKFDELDMEMLNTIDKFVENGLNISNTAKKLYIHRNTLIYRLDKLKKETGFDIKDFKEAAVFFIAFLIWKENK